MKFIDYIVKNNMKIMKYIVYIIIMLLIALAIHNVYKDYENNSYEYSMKKNLIKLRMYAPKIR